MNKFNYTNLTPFKWFVLENFPFIEADFDALTEWQLFCKLGKEMNKIINSENTLGTQVENVTNAFIDLQNYVNNYFDNLDVQEEINNKLNEMAQDGSLANIINQEIFTDLNTKITNLQDEINDIKTEKKTMIVIGDSFSNSAQSGTPLWYTYVSNALNLNVYTNATDGQGYGTGQNNFLVQLQTANEHFTDKSIIDRIYIVGGLNDIGHIDLESFKSALTSTFNYVKNNFPGIKVYIVGILPFQYYNWYTDFLDVNKAKNFNAWLGYTTRLYDFIFISCKYFGLNIPDFYGEPNSHGQCHPSSYGEKFIANMIYNNNRVYGYQDGTSSKINDMPITITNGTNNRITAHINRTDETGINITIGNYDNTQQLAIDNKPFPDFYYVPITDQKGNCNFVYNSSGTIKLLPNTGLEDGTLYIHIPWNWNV